MSRAEATPETTTDARTKARLKFGTQENCIPKFMGCHLLAGREQVRTGPELAPEAWSSKIRSHPASLSASSCNSGFWSRVETRAYPASMFSPVRKRPAGPLYPDTGYGTGFVNRNQ